MMRLYLPQLTALFFFSIFQPAQGQTGQPITVTHKPDATQGSYEFVAQNPNACEYTVTVAFTQLQGLGCSCSLPYVGTVRPGGGTLFTLKRSTPNAQTAFNYTFSSLRGRALKTAPANFPYLLPVAVGKKTGVNESKYIGELLKGEHIEGFYSLVFKMQPGDTVFAARRGVVSATRDDTEPAGQEVWYARETNFVEIYHADGTFARYDKLKRGQIWVKEGSFVEAGQAIGRIGGENFSNGPSLFFRLTYLPVSKSASPVVSYQFVKPHFCTGANPDGALLQDGQTYEAVRPEAVLLKELSKREQKRRLKSF